MCKNHRFRSSAIIYDYTKRGERLSRSKCNQLELELELSESEPELGSS